MARHLAKSRSIVPVPHHTNYAKPIIIRPTLAKPTKKHHGGRGRRGGSRGLMSKERIGIAIGGGLLGFLEKQFGDKIPKIPVLGTTGTIGVAAYLLSDNGNNKLADEVCTAALTVALYTLGNTGSVVGGIEDFDPSAYVSGV